MGRFVPKKNAKQKTAQKKKQKPESFEECMEEAIQFEEQGERYKTGDRAKRNYEKAAELYGKAFGINNQDADCVYNWGRVLFLIADFFQIQAEPEKKLEKIDSSIEKFRKALDLEANKTDVMFNLAQALHQKSEVLQENIDIDNAYGASAISLQEAMGIFDQLYVLQEKEYIEVRAEPEEEQEFLEDRNAIENRIGQNKDFTTFTRVEPTTELSLIETLLSTAETMSTMGSMLASFPASMDLFSRAKAKLALAEEWYEKMPADTSQAGTEKKATRIQINLKEAAIYSSMADRTFVASKTVDSRLFDKSLERLDEIISLYDSQHMEALCDKGDVLISYGQAIAEEALSKESLDSANGGKVWHLLATAAKAFQTALTVEPKNLKILNKLGDLSMIRAQLKLDIAERNRLQLIKNAIFYYKHAVEVDKETLTSGYLGWSMGEWALEEWENVPRKKEDALKIVRVWMRRGGDESLFRYLIEDNEAWDEDFTDFIIENFFSNESSNEE